ncbi:hypothetical protein [Sporisorium scitamineum]|uniref:Uncharacterized protein n=1 Tax=Sporisorium scitamineum TaxID=49012 RepID=A0A0F7RY26_9BASI|nr:hypothetical protein [Sporisorium scitamineum]
MLDVNRLAEELDSLVSSNEQRRRRHNPKSTASPATAAHAADSSNEALYHWHPSDEPAREIASFQQHQLQAKGKRRVEERGFEGSSLFVESSDEEPESVKRIQNWRVDVLPAPSVRSKVASAHSRFSTEVDGASSHLTSVSRSPLSKKSVKREGRERRREDGWDPEATPTLKPKLITRVDWDVNRQIKESHTKSGKSSDKASRTPAIPRQTSPIHLGTHHIARLSDSQFDRLACVSEGPSPQSCAPIPYEPSPSPTPSTSSYHLQPAAPPTTPNPSTAEDDRRTSLDAPATTLSVLEKKASQHIETLDSMIRRHPEKMYQILKDRPGLMLVVLLKCRVEDRISEVQSGVGSARPMVDLTAKVNGREERDCLGMIEESLIDLRFDDADEDRQVEQRMDHCEQLALHQPSVEEQSTPSIVVSQHHTGGLGILQQHSQPIQSGSTSTTAYPTTTLVADDEGDSNAVAELGTRGEAALQQILHRLEQAGELFSVQQTLIALQDRLINTNTDCSRLTERLSALEQAVFAGNTTHNNTPNTSTRA